MCFSTFCTTTPTNFGPGPDGFRTVCVRCSKCWLFSAPKRAIVIYDEPNRPQPRLDRNVEAGFTVNVGRIRPDPSEVFDYMFVTLSHNTIIGAAGSSIMNAEAAIMQGYV